jgi:hypothetical protein
VITTMAKKRTIPKGKPRTLRQRFAARLRDLAGDRTTIDLGEAIGVNHETVRLWLRGDRLPDLDQWPALAKALGVADYRDLLP